MQEDGLLGRRAFVGGMLVAGVSAMALGGSLSADEAAFADEAAEPVDESVRNAQYGFLVKVRNCVDCGECVKACRLWNRIPESEPARRTVVQLKAASGKDRYLSTSCMHCEHPSCADVCPAHAITKGDGGIVTVDQDRCIGCKYCYQACPYGVPKYRSFGMDKCDCCLGNGVPLGEAPHCVQECKLGALRYGRFDDLLAEAGGKAHVIDGGNGPSCALA